MLIECVDKKGNNKKNANNFENVPIKFLNAVNFPRFPKHKLILKKNTIIMLMRNTNKKEGLCNGT